MCLLYIAVVYVQCPIPLIVCNVHNVIVGCMPITIQSIYVATTTNAHSFVTWPDARRRFVNLLSYKDTCVLCMRNNVRTNVLVVRKRLAMHQIYVDMCVLCMIS